MNFYDELKKIYFLKYRQGASVYVFCTHAENTPLKFKPLIGNKNVIEGQDYFLFLCSIENRNRINLCIQKFLYYQNIIKEKVSISRVGKNRKRIFWIKTYSIYPILDSVHRKLSNNHGTNFSNHSIVYGGMERRDTGQ